MAVAYWITENVFINASRVFAKGTGFYVMWNWAAELVDKFYEFTPLLRVVKYNVYI